MSKTFLWAPFLTPSLTSTYVIHSVYIDGEHKTHVVQVNIYIFLKIKLNWVCQVSLDFGEMVLNAITQG